jgi:NADP-dependent alcohol dehydrogenase
VVVRAAVSRRRTTLAAGSSIARSACARLIGGRRTALVADTRLAWLADDLARPAVAAWLDCADVEAGMVRGLATRLRESRPEVILAVGGGTILDAALVAAVGVASPATLSWALDRAERAAVVSLPLSDPLSDRDAIEVIAVPTTLGTSAECNSVAIVRTAQGHRLLRGGALQPRHAVLDAAHYATLPPAAVRAGCLEALLRLAGASTSERAHPRAGAHAIAIARGLIALGDGGLSPESRLRIARYSAATQRSAALRGRAPFSPRHWYVANEVSFVAGTTKMRATASVVAGIWRRIEEGDTRWVSIEPLEAFWREAACDAQLPLAPAAGIDALVTRWGLPLAPRPDADALTLMAVRVERWWGGRGPALRGLTAPEVRDLLEGAPWDSSPSGVTSPSAPIECPPSRREGVMT